MTNGNNNEGVESQPQPTLCSNGCGFFANAGTSGMCSKCHRETERTAQKVEEVAKRAQLSPNAQSAQKERQEETPAAAAAAPSATPPAPPAPCRCNVAACRKKLGLTGFKCRCGHSFCGTHRHAESHECSFDYKTFQRLQIADANPLVQAAKVQKF